MEGHIIKNHLLIVLFVSLIASQSAMAQSVWTDMPTVSAREKSAGVSVNRFSRVREVSADSVLLRSVLERAPMEKTGGQREQIQLPMPDGELKSFYIVESPVMAYELARKFPEIKTYKIRSVSDGTITGRLDITPHGFHAYVSVPEGAVYIDPVSGSVDQYNSYYKRDYLRTSDTGYSCGFTAPKTSLESPVSEFKTVAKTMARNSSNELLTYRLAVATTGEYSQQVAAGNKAGTLAEVLTAINRVNEIYERDLAIRLELIGNNIDIIFTTPGEEGYDNSDNTAMITNNQQVLDTIIGTANYDVGHVFSSGAGGVSAFGVVCNSNFKARGVTGLPNPTGDPFYIDLVAHEIGHQFKASHSFNGTTNNCAAANRNASTAYEPGSGTTIMAYAGICGSENIAFSSDATFHGGSIEEVIAFTRAGSGNACASPNPTGNVAPVVSAGADYIIPARTPFTLSGSATDADTLLYQWDEMDLGAATTSATLGTDLGTNPLFRSFPPTGTANVRTFPELSKILSGSNGDNAETLPTQNRTLRFRLTARDLDVMGQGKGGVGDDDVNLAVDGFSGPFTVLQPNTFVTVDTTAPQHVIEWNSACTEISPVSCANVDILLSTDGGTSFPVTLVNGTPNDGEEAVSIASQVASTARIKIACSDNIFFDIGNQDFALANDGSGATLVSTGNGGSFVCNVPTVITGTGDDIEPNGFAAQAQAITIPFTINGSVNSSADTDDFFVFTGVTGVYSFVLSNFGSNDLDLILLDSSGVNLVEESATQFGTTESISLTLSNGQTYYIVVNGFDTFGLDVSYKLEIMSTASGGGGGGGVVSFWLLGLFSALLLRLASARRVGRLSDFTFY